ncbi:MAG: hypothetical protein QOJ03_1439, partial [Frankiaceae bacterium]|nr:hypothetical protein [Frankiaceae bacterium]
MEPAERLKPYVAGLVVDWLQTMPEARHRRIEGSLAFVDISGFTTLTERLATKGKVGAEEMSDVLDAAFASLLEVAYSYGALLVKWGGDAVLLLFEGPEHALLACRAAGEMRRTMRRIGQLQTSVGAIRLRMSVGVHSGSFDFFLAGRRHRELLVTGPDATVTAAMEGIADAGEIVVSKGTAAELPARCVGAAKGDGLLLRAMPAVDPRCRYWPSSPEAFDAGACLDPMIRDHLLAEATDSEHRQVAVGFVEVSAVDELLHRQGPGAVANALHELLVLVQDECGKHRVTFWETDISKDGFKIMLVAGAPSSSGHDEEGLLRATRSMLDGHTGPLQLRIGVNAGRVFSGEFGPAFRRTLSVKGDAVNLAARVMGKAQHGQLLATATLLQRVHAVVDSEPLPPFLVKGKQHQVHASVVQQVSSARATGDVTLPFAGRSLELQQLKAAAMSARRGRGAAIHVSGDAGSGKSRLVDQVCGDSELGMTVLRTYADDYESATPYFVIGRLLRTALGVAMDAADEDVVRRLRQQVDAVAPELRDWLPLLAVPLGVDIADTEETAGLRDEVRWRRVATVVIDWLVATCEAPTVFVVEDAHSADDASVELLLRVAVRAAELPWLLLLAGRGGAAAPNLGSPHVTELLVPPLTIGEAHDLVVSATDQRPLSPRLMAAVITRAEGNPLFLEELVAATYRTGGGDDLPDTLEEGLAAQLDELPPADRNLLRVASVLGVRFDEPLVAVLTDEHVTSSEWARLARFLVSDGSGGWRFRTALARDAAYEGLPFRRRVELHGRAAVALEAGAGERRTDIAETLSLHYLSAQRFAEAWDYARIAGRRAQQVYANAEALVSHQRALEAARRLPTLPPSELATLLEELGDVHARLAEVEQAASAYRAARGRVPREQVERRARLALSTALVAARGGSMTSGLRWLTTAERELTLPDGAAATPDVVELRARISVERAFMRHVQGREAEAARLCRRAVDEATAASAENSLARALHLLDLVELAIGRPGDEGRVLRALELFERSGDLPRQAGAWNHLGIRAYYDGLWDLAVERYERARTVHIHSGDEWSAAIASANIAEILVDQGRLAEAQPLVIAALRVWRASGTPSDIGFGAALLGRLHSRSGRHPEALALLGEALAAYASSSQRFELIDTQLRFVESLLLQGAAEPALARLDDAEQALRETLRTAGVAASTDAAMDDAGLLPLSAAFAPALSRLQGFALAQTADTAAAEAAMRHAVAAGRARGSAHETAQSLDALVWLLGHAAAAERTERDELFARLGVVWTPVMPHEAR